MPTTTVNNTGLYYEQHGDSGDPVALIHGSWVDHHSWDAMVPRLAQSLQVVCYDRRGHGASPRGPRPRPVRNDAEDLAALLESIDLLPVHIIAHSYGGAVAVRLALDRPELVRSLTIHEPTFIGLLADDPATAPEWDRLSEGIRALQDMVRKGEAPHAARLFVDQYSPEPGAWDRLPEAVRSTFLRNADLWAEELDDPEALTPDRPATRELLIPSLLTSGSLSPGFIYRTTTALAALLRNSQVQVIPEVGHVPHLTRPDQYAGLVLNFLLERNVPST